jgi:hypothetical protein
MLPPLPSPADLLRADSAPPPSGLYLHFAAPTYYAPIQGVILSCFPYEFETHWIDPTVGPERMCVKRARPCPYCSCDTRWHAALAIRLRCNGGLRLVRISAHAARLCDSGHFRRPAKPTRGWGLTLSRLRGGRSGRLEVVMTAPPREDSSLPVAPELGPILAHIYGADRLPATEGGIQ